jgi:DNA-binding MarR family transcriptional regulator
MGIGQGGQIAADHRPGVRDAGACLGNHKKRSRTARQTAASTDVEAFRSLPSFRLHVLASHSKRLHEQLYRKHFGLNLREGCVIAIVGSFGEASIRQTRQTLNLGRASVSLLISRLIRRGLLAKVDDARDRRMTKVVLTIRGRAIHRALHAAEVSLNEEWMAPTTKQQRETFSTCLNVLTTSARNVRKLRES